MKILELLNQQAQQKMNQIGPGQDPSDQLPNPNDEDDSQGKFDADKVDGNLQDLSASVNDNNATPEPVGGAEEPAPELDDQNVDPLDDALMAQIRTLPYSTKYDFGEKDNLNPIRIAGMEIADLSNLSNTVQFKMQTEMLKNPVGGADNDTIQFCNDLLRFINVVMKFKKSNTSAQLSKTSPSPAYQTMKPKQ
jgi:hypothetical protein